MRISEINNTELRELAELRRAQEGSNNSNILSLAFSWLDAPEGGLFWNKVDNGVITEPPNKIDKIQVVRDGHLEFRNVNNAPAEDNAIHELRADAKERDLSKLVDTLDDTINKLKALINK